MKNKTINILLIIFFVILVLVSLIVSMIDWAWVKVHAYDSDVPIRISMPVPLNLAWFALNFVPSEEIPRELYDVISRNRVQIEKALQDLQEAPDSVLVKVETPKEKVIIEKRKESIFIDVTAEDAHVEVSLPIRSFVKMLKKLDRKVIIHEDQKREAF